ncbi:MAG: hypothetical protein IT291_05290 [Deltaproteobacteria bacterium]|nr:hypothetical protein [Deltaproteobacteria bacterium]
MANTLCAHMQRLAEALPEYELNLTWPSVGTLDLLTYHLRGKTTLEENDLYLINCVAAYLAGMTHDIWARYPERLAIDVKLSPSVKEEVIIAARFTSGPLANKTFSIYLSQILNNLLVNPPKVLPVFADFRRRVPSDHNILSLFATGLFSGLCPFFAEGPWNSASIADCAEHLSIFEQVLAKSAATYYAKVFPLELLGQNHEIYLNNLVLPPAGHKEDFVACRATANLTSFLVKQKCLPKDVERLAVNLARSPDELISQAGLALAIALQKREVEPPLYIRSICEAKKNYVHLLRPAVMLARKVLGIPHDWAICLEQGKIEKAIELIELEKYFGLLPHLILPPKMVSQAELKPLFNAIAWSNVDAGMQAIDYFKTKNISSPELLLQEIYFRLIRDEIDKTEELLATFIGTYSDGAFSQMHIALKLQALCAFLKNDFLAASRILEQALQVDISGDTSEFVAISNDYAWSLMLLFRPEHALPILDSAIAKDPHSILARVNRLRVLEMLERKDDMQIDLAELKRFAPMHRTVFSYLLANI